MYRHKNKNTSLPVDIHITLYTSQDDKNPNLCCEKPRKDDSQFINIP